MGRKSTKRRLAELSRRAADAGVVLRCCQCGRTPEYLFMSDDGLKCVSCTYNPIPSDELNWNWMAYGIFGFGDGVYDEPF